MDLHFLYVDNFAFPRKIIKLNFFDKKLSFRIESVENKVFILLNSISVATLSRLKEHVDDPTKLPILIFPEGTCINNTSVMQFKKGSFEVGGTIYPVAIKYDPIFGDAFWNSSQNGMASYIYLMMTSWAIVCDVWYLPPMTRGESEDAVDFANR